MKRVHAPVSSLEFLSCCGVVNFELFTPFREAHYFSAKREHPNVPSVSRLVESRSPFTIFSAVISVIIYSVYSVLAGWSFSHVFDESDETIPSFTNRNTPSSVVTVRGRFRVHATVAHEIPDIVLSGVPSSVPVIISGIPTFALEASATLDIPGVQFCCDGCFCISAFAITQPNFPALDRFEQLDHGQPSKYITN
jgi:hypothetical protein